MRGALAEGEEDSGDSTSGAEETEAAPVLAEALRVDIPRASLRYLLTTCNSITGTRRRKRHFRTR